MDSLISSAQAVVQIWKAVSSCQITGLIIIISYVYIVLFILRLPKALYKFYIYKIVQAPLGWLVLVSRSAWQLLTFVFLHHMKTLRKNQCRAKALGKSKRHRDDPGPSQGAGAFASCNWALRPSAGMFCAPQNWGRTRENPSLLSFSPNISVVLCLFFALWLFLLWCCHSGTPRFI